MTRFVTGKQGNLYNNQYTCTVEEYNTQFNKVEKLNKKWNKICKQLFNLKNNSGLTEICHKAKAFKKNFVREYNMLTGMHYYLKFSNKSPKPLLAPEFNKANIILSHKLLPAEVKYDPMPKAEYDENKDKLLFRHNGDKKRLLIQKQSLQNRLVRLEKIHKLSNSKSKKSYIKPMSDEAYVRAVEFANKSLDIVEEKLSNVVKP